MKHGLTNTRLYKIYTNMKQRCYNRNDPKYSSYGGRGITICTEWLNDFQSFYDWPITHGYADDLTIDRIDGTKGYSPDNCRWVTWEENRKTGGRKTSNPKNHETRIRMSDEDIEILEICCEETGMSKSDVIRKGIREVYEKIKNKSKR